VSNFDKKIERKLLSV
jgi:hypothetical protein